MPLTLLQTRMMTTLRHLQMPCHVTRHYQSLVALPGTRGTNGIALLPP